MINKNPLQPVKNKVQFSGSSRVHKMATNNNGLIFRPIIVLNLTAEMLYVLNQRMVAQSIHHSKQREVITSILNKAFDPEFLSKLYTPTKHDELQKLGTIHQHTDLRTMFQSFAHASVMRLNKTSMDKLYDLMVMCLKYQLTHLRTAVEIHAITLNHLDSLERMLDNPQAFFQNEKDKMEKFKNTNSDANSTGISMIRNAKTGFIKHFSKIANTDYETIRMNLLKFSGEQHTRISMFLRNNVQDDRGRFVVNPEHVKTRVPFQFVNSEVLDVCYRGSDLGLSLYHSFGRKASDVENSGEKNEKTKKSPENRKKSAENRKSVTELDEDVALGEICILTSFIGQSQDGDGDEEDFSPDIFNDEELDMF
jgi:hypothetical protein